MRVHRIASRPHVQGSSAPLRLPHTTHGLTDGAGLVLLRRLWDALDLGRWLVPDPTTFGRWLRPGGAPMGAILDRLLWRLVATRWRDAPPEALTGVVDSTVVVRYGMPQAGAERGWSRIGAP